MDRAGSRDAVADQQSVRDRMRTRAREQTGGERGPYLTPQWLDHSFVLPAAPERGEVALPSPRGESPAPAASPRPAEPVYERPASPEIDFGAVMRRADTGRRARIVTAVALVLTLVAAIVFQVTGQPAAAGIALVAAVVALGAAGWRMVLNRAPVPYLEG